MNEDEAIENNLPVEVADQLQETMRFNPDSEEIEFELQTSCA